MSFRSEPLTAPSLIIDKLASTLSAQSLIALCERKIAHIKSERQAGFELPFNFIPSSRTLAARRPLSLGTSAAWTAAASTA